MKNIIAYSMEKLYKDLEEADELFLSSGMKDMELYEKQLAEAARKAAAEHMAALYSDMDRMLCEDISRAEKYTIQRHDERQLLTTVGPVCFTHTLFRSCKDGTCHYLLDEWMELDAHERLSSRAEAEVLAEAVKTSYASAARVLGEDSLISKTAVMDKVHGIQTELPFPKPEKKKCVEYLYVEADEDHIHKQEKNGTEKKGSMIGKLLYLYEGQEKKDGRKELKNVFYLGGLCSGGEANRHLFERMQEYIDTNYESRYLNAVYISGDGGAWIKAGAEYIEKGVPVLDKFHMMKYINKAANQMLDEAGEAKGRLWKALYKGKKKKFVKTIKAIRKCAPNEKAVNDCEEYLLNNWDSAVRRIYKIHIKIYAFLCYIVANDISLSVIIYEVCSTGLDHHHQSIATCCFTCKEIFTCFFVNVFSDLHEFAPCDICKIINGISCFFQDICTIAGNCCTVIKRNSVMCVIYHGVGLFQFSEIIPVNIHVFQICESIRIALQIFLIAVVLHQNDVRKCAVVTSVSCCCKFCLAVIRRCFDNIY